MVLLVALILHYLPSITSLFKHLLLIEEIGHFWTIPVEFSFYLLVPILSIIINKIANNKISIIFLIILLVITAMLSPFTKYIENSINLRWYLSVFFMGMITAFFYIKFLKTKKKSNINDIIICVIMFLMFLSVPNIRNLLFRVEPSNYLQNKYLYFGVACVLLFWL